MEGKAAVKRYVKALLDYAVEKKQEEQVFIELTEFTKVLEQSVDFQRVLSSPIVKSSVKKEILDKVFSNKESVMGDFINLLVKNKRLSLMLYISKGYIQAYHDFKKRQQVTIVTAVELSKELFDSVLEKVKKLTNNQNILLRNKVDSSIIGGFIIRIGDLQYNASVFSKLNSLERDLENNLYANV